MLITVAKITLKERLAGTHAAKFQYHYAGDVSCSCDVTKLQIPRVGLGFEAVNSAADGSLNFQDLAIWPNQIVCAW
jgi:hypothetical protein